MPVRESVSIDEAIGLLNSAFECDANCMQALITNRIPCNQLMTDHPTIQVDPFGGHTKLGLLGVINGLFGVDENGAGPIAVVFDKGPVKFCRTK